MQICFESRHLTRNIPRFLSARIWSKLRPQSSLDNPLGYFSTFIPLSQSIDFLAHALLLNEPPTRSTRMCLSPGADSAWMPCPRLFSTHIPVCEVRSVLPEDGPLGWTSGRGGRDRLLVECRMRVST